MIQPQLFSTIFRPGLGQSPWLPSSLPKAASDRGYTGPSVKCRFQETLPPFCPIPPSQSG